MTKEEILKQIEELKETNRRVEKNAEELRKEVENLSEDKKKIRTLPIKDEKYFFISTTDLCSYERNYPVFFDNYQTKENSSIGNYFKSKEDAEMVIRAMKLEQAIRIRRIELNDGWEPNWDDESDNKYLISEFDNSLYSENAFIRDISPIFGYYKTAYIAYQIIDEFEDDLLWYFNEYYPNKDKMYVWEETNND